MKKYLLILCLLLQINLFGHKIEKKYFFSICAIFKNEATYLKEWIEYHRIQGCECFYLYNNESTDNFLKVLQPYIETGIVELIDWPNSKNAINHCVDQSRAYNHNLKSLKEVSEWVAYIDIDEFLLAKQGLRVSEYLHTFDRLPNVGALKVNWQLFGTSNVNKIPEGEPIIQYLIKKAPWNFDEGLDTNNLEYKTIVRPLLAIKKAVHEVFLNSNSVFYPFEEEGYRCKFKPHMTNAVMIDEICLNHYIFRDNNFLMNIKLPRKTITKGQSYEQKYLNIFDKLNQVEDYEIYAWLPELKQRM